MKKLLLIVMILLMAVLYNPFDVMGKIINDIGSLTDKAKFEQMLNEKHYLIKSIALDPNKMDKDTYNTLYTFLDIDWISKKKAVEFISKL